MISYYELLTLIKERKQPDKVKYKGEVYSWNGEYYKSDDYGEYLSAMFEIHMFNKNIEIIEDKPKKIEALPIKLDGFTDSYYDTALMALVENFEEMRKAVNYLLEVDKHE